VQAGKVSLTHPMPAQFGDPRIQPYPRADRSDVKGFAEQCSGQPALVILAVV
jgi:hypothetical protein